MSTFWAGNPFNWVPDTISGFRGAQLVARQEGRRKRQRRIMMLNGQVVRDNVAAVLRMAQ